MNEEVEKKKLNEKSRECLNQSAANSRHQEEEKKKQVAQRAMIALLSPMCQGQPVLKPYAAFPPPQWCYT